MGFFAGILSPDKTKNNSGNSSNLNETNSSQLSQDASFGGDIRTNTFGKLVDSNVTVNNLDGGIIDAGVKLVDDALENVFTFLGGSITASNAADEQAAAVNSQVIDDSFSFAGGAAVNATDQLLANLDFIAGENDDIRNFEAGVVQAAFDDIALTREFTAGLTGEVLDNQAQAFEASTDAITRGAEQSLEFAAGAFQTGINEISGFANNSFEFLGEATTFLFNTLTGATSDQLAQNSALQQESLDVISESSKSASQETNEMIFKLALGLIAVVGLGAMATTFKVFKK